MIDYLRAVGWRKLRKKLQIHCKGVELKRYDYIEDSIA